MTQQRTYARLSGFLFLWLIVTGLAGVLITSNIAGSGTFAEKAKRVAASEHLYRIALTSDLIEAVSAALLAFTLYATLKPVDKLLAQLAMYFRLGEAFTGSVGMMFSFARLNLYTRAPTAQAEALVDLTHYLGTASYNIASLFFSIGSLLFFYVFYKSTYLPKMLSAFGIFASVVVTIIALGGLIFPEYSGTLQYGWAAMAIAEVVVGIWLMIFGVPDDAQA
jgi:hypothetical protein